MSSKYDDHYFDLDNFDESLDSRDYRRRQPDRRPSSYNGRPVYRTSVRRKRRRRNKKRLRNRVIIVSGAVIILVLIILLFSALIRGCSGKSDKNPQISTDTIANQQASYPATKSEPDVPDDLSPTYFKTPVIEDNNTNGAIYYGIYVWNKTGYELFGGDTERSQNYAETINGFADKLDGFTVYNMMIPNHTEFGLPQRLKSSDAYSTSQADSIKDAYAALGNKVTPINAYNYLADHNKEYIYFKSDHHWTGLGAYYAYKAFADTNKLPTLSLESCTEQTIDGFTGSFSNTAEGIDSDTVHYWQFPYDVTMNITDANGNDLSFDSPYYSSAGAGSDTYGVFIVGDNPLTVMKSSSENARAGKKLAIVKESYGNAIAPYFTNNYKEVHVIDFRYFRDTIGKDFVSYCHENGITDVLFINGIMSANTQIQLDSMSGMF